MASPLLDRNQEAYGAFMHHIKRLPMADGIMINTFELLEKRAVQALVDGLCLPMGGRMPPLYCIDSTHKKRLHLLILDQRKYAAVPIFAASSVSPAIRKTLAISGDQNVLSSPSSNPSSSRTGAASINLNPDASLVVPRRRSGLPPRPPPSPETRDHKNAFNWSWRSSNWLVDSC
ncbi:uncharacterized protein A4U43_UnF11800 [Asparagus officinalis]|uniref:Uncharacterized protein n=1 Tax=Asparagus officinalis TaxID=4686 RepID=A0A1R3L571_ASPOF|nr:uncharacterized protein A4U43_UnF11800 [Asparagus officinalis]